MKFLGNKKTRRIGIVSVVVIICSIVATFYLSHVTNHKAEVKDSFENAVSLVNDKHEFGMGYNNLKDIGSDKAEGIIKNYDAKVKTAKVLSDVEEAINGADISDAKDGLKRAKDLDDTTGTFEPAIKYLENDVKKYDEAVKEIKDGNDPEKVVEKYHFNHEKLAEKLKQGATKEEAKKESPKTSAAKTESQTPAKQEKSGTKVSSYEEALVQNYNHYEQAVFGVLRNYASQLPADIDFKDVNYGGMSGNRIFVKFFNSKGKEIGTAFFTYNQAANTVSIESPQTGPMATYPAVYYVG